MRTAITGATGHLGRLTIRSLIDQGARAKQVVVLAHDFSKTSALTTLGVQVRHADYRQPETLREALRGVDRLLPISSGDFQDRVQQRQNVIDAAREAGVKLIAYTSILNADRRGP